MHGNGATFYITLPSFILKCAKLCIANAHVTIGLLQRFYEILVIIPCAQKPPINVHTSPSSESIGLTFDLSHHRHPNFVYASSEGSGESVNLRRLT